MGKAFAAIEVVHRAFIEEQHVFFIASAAAGARVNVSPKPTGALRVVDERTTIYLDQTGSGNETSAHLRADGRLTLMFCALEGPPQILRLFGRGEVVPRGTGEYAALLERYYDGVEPPGARQIVRLCVDLVRTSCGFGVPRFAYRGERDTLDRWARAKGDAALEAYRREKNAVSIDGLPASAAPAEA